MEMLILVLIIVVLCIWYGLFSVVEDGIKVGRKVAQRNLKRLDAQSQVKDAEQWVNIGSSLSEDLILKKAEAKAKLKLLLDEE
jgi:cell division protein FtsL